MPGSIHASPGIRKRFYALRLSSRSAFAVTSTASRLPSPFPAGFANYPLHRRFSEFNENEAALLFLYAGNS
ncbi:TPA: hypothetical protein QH850_002983 [Enterobacter chengduensis]|nr:hypothetical protein [Enterobacter chengduensis]